MIPVAVAVALGLFTIGAKSLWLDEAFSVAAARLPTTELVTFLLTSELHAAPYYLILHAWLGLGTGEAVVRALSVIFGALGVLATYHIGKRYGVAWPAALILAVSPLLVQYEQEARGYTMLVAGSAISTLLYLRMTERPDLVRALAYVAAGALMIYIHPLGALVVVAHVVGAVIFVAPPLRTRVVLTFLPIALAWLPMVQFAMTHPGEISWIQPTDFTDVQNAALVLGGGALMAGVLLVMLVLGARRDLTLLWLIVPIVGTLAITFLIQPVLHPRYLLSVLPAMALIAARNKASAVAILVAISLLGVGNWYAFAEKDDWRGAAAWVTAEVEPGDAIVFAPTYMRLAFGYYARVGVPLHADVPWESVDLFGGPGDVAVILAHERVWLVEGYGRELPDDVRSAIETFQVVETRDFGGNGVWVSLLQRNPLTPVGEP